MGRYSTSLFRIFLLTVMLGAIVAVVSTSFGQPAPGSAAAPAPGAPPKPTQTGLTSIILTNIDFVFITIALLSIIGLTLIIQGFIQNRSTVLMPPETTARIRDMIAARQFKELIDFTENDPSFISKALNPALKRAPSYSGMKEAMETAVGEQTAEQFRKIEYLNIIGNLGPLLGLLGTVLGMIYAFSAVSSTGGQANVAELSAGISKALAHTFTGLCLAVPCLAAFGVLRTIVDRLTTRGALICEELLMMIRPQEAPRPGAIPGRPGTAVPQPGAGIPPPPPVRKMPAPSPSSGM